MEWVKDNKSTLQWISFLLVLLSFPLLNIGVRDGDTLAWIGLGMVVLGFAIPPLVKLLGPKEEGGDEEEDEEEDESQDEGESSEEESLDDRGQKTPRGGGPDKDAEKERLEDRGQNRPEGGG
jgi:flagellar biosynthesis/type III secretory pathway M-ring protein FliF/YscJ